jgi:hypothetical protein
MVYIIQLRPEIRDDTIADCDLKGRDWEWVVGQAVDSKATLDRRDANQHDFVSSDSSGQGS